MIFISSLSEIGFTAWVSTRGGAYVRTRGTWLVVYMGLVCMIGILLTEYAVQFFYTEIGASWFVGWSVEV